MVTTEERVHKDPGRQDIELANKIGGALNLDVEDLGPLAGILHRARRQREGELRGILKKQGPALETARRAMHNLSKGMARKNAAAKVNGADRDLLRRAILVITDGLSVDIVASGLYGKAGWSLDDASRLVLILSGKPK